MLSLSFALSFFLSLLLSVQGGLFPPWFYLRGFPTRGKVLQIEENEQNMKVFRAGMRQHCVHLHAENLEGSISGLHWLDDAQAADCKNHFFIQKIVKLRETFSYYAIQ
jgi:hypothetical protein